MDGLVLRENLVGVVGPVDRLLKTNAVWSNSLVAVVVGLYDNAVYLAGLPDRVVASQQYGRVAVIDWGSQDFAELTVVNNRPAQGRA